MFTCPSVIVGILVGMSVLVIVIVACFCHRLKKVQQKLERLSEEDVKQFLEGSTNVNDVSQKKDERADAAFCVDFLPYNGKYEVPKRQISLGNSKTELPSTQSLIIHVPHFSVIYSLPIEDKVLGSGTYGIVNKGIVWLGSELIPVAIKTIRPGVDISYFKALLSELKIMAYIGNGHENIVHLVAACTENIRNRRPLAGRPIDSNLLFL
jgi:hypothetical protein